MIAPRIVESLRLGAYGNCLINAWFGLPNKQNLAALHEYTAEVVALTSSFSYFVILEPGTTVLDSEQRKDIKAIYVRWGDALRSVAQVVEGGNLWSVTARSVMTAMRLMQRRPYPTKVFSEVEEGVEWIAPFIARPDNDTAGTAAEGLLKSIRALRAMPIPPR